MALNDLLMVTADPGFNKSELRYVPRYVARHHLRRDVLGTTSGKLGDSQRVPERASTPSAPAMANGAATRPSRLALAMDFLKELLRGGPVDQHVVKDKAIEAGLAYRTVERAKEVLCVRSDRQGWGPGRSTRKGRRRPANASSAASPPLEPPLPQASS